MGAQPFGGSIGVLRWVSSVWPWWQRERPPGGAGEPACGSPARSSWRRCRARAGELPSSSPLVDAASSPPTSTRGSEVCRRCSGGSASCAAVVVEGGRVRRRRSVRVAVVVGSSSGRELAVLVHRPRFRRGAADDSCFQSLEALSGGGQWVVWPRLLRRRWRRSRCAGLRFSPVCNRAGVCSVLCTLYVLVNIRSFSKKKDYTSGQAESESWPSSALCSCHSWRFP